MVVKISEMLSRTKPHVLSVLKYILPTVVDIICAFIILFCLKTIDFGLKTSTFQAHFVYMFMLTTRK